MDTSINSIISKFISKEVENIYNRYNSIPEEEINSIRKFIEKVEENNLDFDVFLNYDVTKAVAEVASEIDNLDFLRLYLLLRNDVKLVLDLYDTNDVFIALNEVGYCKVQGYYIYNNVEVMKELAKNLLDKKLEDAYQVTDMFSIEELADMWISGTSKEEAARQYQMDNNWWNILECDVSEDAYTDSYGKTINYCYYGEV